MAKARATSRPLNRRGSPEAIEKRRVARMFNDVLGGNGPASGKLDGRTEKRRQRLLRELGENKAHGEKELKPLDVLTRVQELLELGEPLASIKKARKIPKPSATNASTVELIQRLHKAYGFKPECYRFVGIADEVLGDAGVIQTESPRRSKRRRAA
jgi:hypothetical protein